MKSFLAGFLFVVILTGMVGGVWYTRSEEKSKGVVQEKVAVKTAAPTTVVQKTSAPIATTGPTVAAVQQKQLEVNFSKEGALVNRENIWTLLYEEPGDPVVIVNLKFDNNSKCEMGACDTSKFIEGTRVLVSGNKSGEVVTVVKMETKQGL